MKPLALNSQDSGYFHAEYQQVKRSSRYGKGDAKIVVIPLLLFITRDMPLAFLSLSVGEEHGHYKQDLLGKGEAKGKDRQRPFSESINHASLITLMYVTGILKSYLANQLYFKIRCVSSHEGQLHHTMLPCSQLSMD